MIVFAHYPFILKIPKFQLRIRALIPFAVNKKPNTSWHSFECVNFEYKYNRNY